MLINRVLAMVARGFARLCLLIAISGNALALTPAGQPEPDAAGWKVWAAPDSAYSLSVPVAWQLEWTPAPAGGGASQLRLMAPDATWPDDVLIDVEHYAAAHRTPERYLNELLRPSFGRLTDKLGVLTARTVAGVIGIPASTLEVRHERQPLPGMTTAPVPALRRYVVVPAHQGFFVLRYDTPQQLAANHQADFERLVDSFVPTDRAARADDPIGAEEYAVYAAFFTAPAPPRSAGDPQGFFWGVKNTRTVLAPTRSLSPEQLASDWPARAFDGLDPALVSQYRERNRKQWTLTDRIAVEHLTVLSRREHDVLTGSRGPGRRSPPSPSLVRDYLSFSRVAFNPAGDVALFEVSHTNPGAIWLSYLVMMRQVAGNWVYGDIVMAEFLYH